MNYMAVNYPAIILDLQPIIYCTAIAKGFVEIKNFRK